jgi:hypothetical protein
MQEETTCNKVKTTEIAKQLLQDQNETLTKTENCRAWKTTKESAYLNHQERKKGCIHNNSFYL